MKGIQVSSYIPSPDLLQVTDLPDLQPSPTHYLIKISAAGTNFFDLLQIAGKYQHQPPLPWISGSEFAGTVVAVPTSPSKSGKPWRFKVGDRVFGANQGAYATQIYAPEPSLLPIPASWSFRDAAGLYVTAPTAYTALVTRAQTQPGEWVLVHAGAGGVGLSAVQFAKALGATVIATASTDRKRQICLDFGADYVIDYRSPKWPDQVIEICKTHRTGNGKAGVDVVYDPVGMIGPSLKCVAWNARLLVIGFAAGKIEKLALNRVLLKNVSVIGLHLGEYAKKEPQTTVVVWKAIFDLIQQKKFRSIVFGDRKFVGLDSVKDALKALGERGTWGKVVCDIDDADSQKARL
ncbi:putative alcohol zinc-containing [Phaeomoniella chlamydospora]|uniref:Putative alcohol zinc-containing n=1 Tax=Phaeomoniella chlamydospora TaxID=158046 RepID=A0A0G2ECT8_PHACM|nr:putative alcohol zinc-containing [Phaeomoniella chlamydospora]